MTGTFEENLKQADTFAEENPDKIAHVVMHYRVVRQGAFAEADREQAQEKLDAWLNKETEAFVKLFRNYDTRMRKFAEQKRYTEAYNVWADFPPDYPFPRFTALIWGAFRENIPEKELEMILEKRGPK